MFRARITMLAVAAGLSLPAAAEDGWIPETWLSTRTASVQLYHAAGSPVPRPALRGLELAVQELGHRLGLSPSAFASLRSRPIHYLYAQEAEGLSWFGIDAVDGLAMVAERKVLSTRLPHRHELVHVLSYIAIEPAPPGNQPWLQEGLASYLGGQLGELPAAVLARGDKVLDRNPRFFPAHFGADTFRDSRLGAESTYAASARFVQFLDEELGGMGPLLALSRLLAGFEEEVRRRPVDVVETQLEGIYSIAGPELLERFADWRARNPVSGIVPADRPLSDAQFVVVDRDHRVEWWTGEEGWVLAVEPLRGAVDFALAWASAPVSEGVWTAPVERTGMELRVGPEGGRLLDHEGPSVVLSWYGDFATDDGSVVWFIPSGALVGVPSPGDAGELRLWSQPRFEVD